MTPVQKLEVRMSELRRELRQHLDADEKDHDAINRLTGELGKLDSELVAAKLLEEPAKDTVTERRESDDKFLELRNSLDMAVYVAAAAAGTGVAVGAEGEYNAEVGLRANEFPLSILARGLEKRAARDGDGAATQATWLDRVLDGSAASAVGVTMRPVAPGVHSVPQITAGASGVQRGRTEAVAEGTYTLGITDLTPTRNAVYGVYSLEDDYRVPGYSEALIRDMQAGVMEAVDKAIFSGDTGANEATADINGFLGSALAAAQEITITQANKVLATGVMAAFGGMIDGAHAMTPSDLRAVLFEGANTLWMSTIPGEAQGGNMSIMQTIRGNGIMPVVRGGVETATANDDFGAVVGLGRNIDGAAVAAVWDRGRLDRVVDTTRATQGEEGLVLSYFWDFAVPRASNYRRIKFVT